MRPQLADRGGWALFISKPAGMNWFHDLFQLGQGGSDQWRSWQRPSTDNTFIRDIAAEIEESRLTMGDAYVRVAAHGDQSDRSIVMPRTQ